MSLFEQKITQQFRHQQQLDKALDDSLINPTTDPLFLQHLETNDYLQNALIRRLTDDLWQKRAPSPQAMRFLAHLIETAPDNPTLQQFHNLITHEQQQRTLYKEALFLVFGNHGSCKTIQNEEERQKEAIRRADKSVLIELAALFEIPCGSTHQNH